MLKTKRALALMLLAFMFSFVISNADNADAATVTQSGQSEELNVTIKSVTSGNPYSYLYIDVEGGTAPYTYSYVYTRKSNGEQLDKRSDVAVYLSGNGNEFGLSVNTDAYATNCGSYPTAGFSGVGTNHLDITVKDSTGATCNVGTDIEVEPFEVTNIYTDVPSGQRIGTTIRLDASAKNRFNGYCSRVPLFYTWKVTNLSTGKTEIIPGISASNTCYWTPTVGGKYIVEASVDSYDVGSTSIEYEIFADNKISVYYANSNWNDAYIHFKTQNGEWTDVPGLKMESCDCEGYTWKFDIQLDGDNSYSALVCFNNGNGDWDSRNGQNYYLNKGAYGIRNGNVESLGFKVTSFTIDKTSPIGCDDARLLFEAVAEYGSGDYSYRFGGIHNGVKGYGYDFFSNTNNQSHVLATFYKYSLVSDKQLVGTHTLFVEVKDNITGQIATKTIENFVVKPLRITSFTSDAPSSVISVGTPVVLSAETEYEVGYRYNSYVFTIIKDGVRTTLEPWNYWSHYSKTWTPTEAGDYTVEYYVRDGADQEAVATLHFTVVDSNKTTLYYNNNNWSQAYVHYCINGQWTAVPGVAMADSDKDGYRWKFDFDLGEAEGVTVCFTDGNGNWDSRNASNYYIGTGKYGIKDGSIYELND